MAQYIPDSTPTTDVNKFASDELVVADESVFPGMTSSFFASLVPGITRLPLTGAFEVVNVAALILLSCCIEKSLASRMIRSLRRS